MNENPRKSCLVHMSKMALCAAMAFSGAYNAGASTQSAQEASSPCAQPPGQPALMPMPRKVKWQDGTCPTNAVISKSNDPAIPPEGYRLEVSGNGISIASSDADGAFYAEKTLAQLAVPGGGYRCASIEDSPAFRWRGALIDEARHFQGKQAVKRMIDLLSNYKFNVLHWHLTDDQGWRIDVPGLPELAKRGAMREESWDGADHYSSAKHEYGTTVPGGKTYVYYEYRVWPLNGEKYGPFFYTEADLREIVAYAKKRHVTIVPEIELPGHSYAALAAYPELSCFPWRIGRSAACSWGQFRDVFCAGNDDTVKFMEKVLNYVCDVFPSKVIHIGGDECPRVNWEMCTKCRARMEDEGMKGLGDLQAWITRKAVDILARRGRRAIGWDEVLIGEVPKTAIGQSWRKSSDQGSGTEHITGASAAKDGFDVVMSPYDLTYYSYRQGIENDPFYRSGVELSLETAYTFDPLSGVDESARPHILGGECCVWGESVRNFYDLSWKMWPRAFAMSEVLWTHPAKRDFTEFEGRAAVHRVRLLRQGINCAPLK